MCDLCNLDEDEDQAFELKHTISAACGLLSPKGVLYPCGFTGHYALADALRVGDYWMNDYLHVSNYKVDEGRNPPTQDQLDTIFDYYVHHKDRPMPVWLLKYFPDWSSSKPNERSKLSCP